LSTSDARPREVIEKKLGLRGKRAKLDSQIGTLEAELGARQRPTRDVRQSCVAAIAAGLIA
jgi:hypothetical protein